MQVIRLNPHEIAEGLNTLDSWNLDPQASSIQKEWVFDSFKTAIHFIVGVGEIAENHNHHPEFLSTYTKVQIRLVTHDADGLTHKDFELALAIDQLVQRDF